MASTIQPARPRPSVAEPHEVLDRRGFIGLAGAAVAAAAMPAIALAAETPEATDDVDADDPWLAEEETEPAEPARPAGDLPDLPPASPDPENMFGVDLNINVANVDAWLDRPDVAYRDVRMLRDPADYAAIGGDSDLTAVIEGFRIVPYPFVGTLQELPVGGAYDGPALFDVEWADGEVARATPNYVESELIVDDLFPKDKAVFIMCGGAGYANMMRKLLIYLGWDESRVYNVGAGWEYEGDRAIVLVQKSLSGEQTACFWRADYAMIDFDDLTPLE